MRLKNTCSIYLVFGRKLKIPVNPEEIEINIPSNNKEHEVLGVGTVVIPRKPGLKVVSWESFFPADRSEPYVNSGAKSPKAYVDAIEKAMKEKQIGRLIISRSGLYDTNMRCVVSDFTTNDQGGEPKDMYYSIELQEYRNYAPKTVVILSETASGESAQAAAEEQRPVETPALRVGAPVIANGKYWYDSYGSKPFGTANNLSTTVTRIVEGNLYPVHVGHYGWLTADQLQIVG